MDRARNHSRVRVGVEHAIGGVKQYHTMRGPYRGTMEEFEQDLSIVCGLANMRRMIRNGTYDKWIRRNTTQMAYCGVRDTDVAFLCHRQHISKGPR